MEEPPPHTELGVPTPVQAIDAPKLEKVLAWLIDQVVSCSTLPPTQPPPHYSFFAVHFIIFICHKKECRYGNSFARHTAMLDV